MSDKVSQAKLMATLKARAKGAWSRSRKVKAEGRGGGGFPPNLKNLVAVCSGYALKTTKKGDPFFQLTAVVKDPEEFVGRRAVFMWFINDSEYATVEDNLNMLSNDLQLLGKEMPADIDDVPGVMAELCEAGVHLLFNTGGPRKNGNSPNLFIQGLADDWPDEPYEDGSSNDAADDSGDATDDATTGDNPGDDGADPEANAADDDPWIPAKGEKYKYTPPKSKTAIVVTVVAVDKKKETFTLKGGKPPKEFKGIAWFDKDGNPTVESHEE